MSRRNAGCPAVGKVANLDRIDSTIMPDAVTATGVISIWCGDSRQFRRGALLERPTGLNARLRVRPGALRPGFSWGLFLPAQPHSWIVLLYGVRHRERGQSRVKATVVEILKRRVTSAQDKADMAGFLIEAAATYAISRASGDREWMSLVRN
jgi:hypothetical protein